jgi:hypothetical protein
VRYRSAETTSDCRISRVWRWKSHRNDAFIVDIMRQERGGDRHGREGECFISY